MSGGKSYSGMSTKMLSYVGTTLRKLNQLIGKESSNSKISYVSKHLHNCYDQSKLSKSTSKIQGIDNAPN